MNVEEKNLTEIASGLMMDLCKKYPHFGAVKIITTWEEQYRTLPSCKGINSSLYYELMEIKYQKTYDLTERKLKGVDGI